MKKIFKELFSLFIVLLPSAAYSVNSDLCGMFFSTKGVAFPAEIHLTGNPEEIVGVFDSTNGRILFTEDELDDWYDQVTSGYYNSTNELPLADESRQEYHTVLEKHRPCFQ